MKNINEPDYHRIALTLFLVAIILMGWQMLVEWPRRQHLAQSTALMQKKQAEIKEKKAAEIKSKGIDTDYNPNLTRAQRLALSKRLPIESEKLHGSIALKGARFDDLTLAKYKVSLEKDSPDVTLLTPNGDESAYFAQAGWVAADGATKVPDDKSEWKSDNTRLSPESSVTLNWDNGEGVTFFQTITLDKDYMFTINQRVENNSGREISVAPFAYINRAYHESNQHNIIMHEGPLGTMEGAIGEISYKDLREKKQQNL